MPAPEKETMPTTPSPAVPFGQLQDAGSPDWKKRYQAR
jgi:hypothetical protein